MKTAITFTASPVHSNSGLLLHVANLMHRLRINPELLNWSAADQSGVWLWMVVIREERHLADLVTALEATDGVCKVRAQPVEPLPATKTGGNAPPANTQEPDVITD